MNEGNQPAAVSGGDASEKRALSKEGRAELAASLDRLERYAQNARSDATRRAYAADLEDFRHWCDRYGREWLPATPNTVGLYIGARARELKLSTLERRLAAIGTLHKGEGYDSPASVAEAPLRRIWRGLVREKTRQTDSPEPLMAEELRQMIASLPRYEAPFEKEAFRASKGDLTLTALRDRAVLLVGWAGALRRSELVALRSQDITFQRGRGFTMLVARSKGDQEGEGQYKGIPYGDRSETCPVLTSTGTSSAALTSFPAATCNAGSRVASGRGTPASDGPTVGTPSGSFRCGTPTASSCTPTTTLARRQASATRTTTLFSFRRPFGAGALPGAKKAS